MKINKKHALLIICIALFLNASAQLVGGDGEANPHLTTNKEALQSFQNNRFGMFIHWGPVALRGTEIGWSRGVEVPKEEYDNLYKEFNPVLFDAATWVKTAKDAGMKYIVITTRHHDGFSLWDSKYSDYDMAATPYGKGVLKELSDECKKQDIDFAIYYSICDWRHPDYPVEYPAPDYKLHVEEGITNPVMKAQMDRYILFMKAQLEELIENYNPAYIWFDGEWEWAWTHEMGMDMYAWLRGLKNDLLINNRVDKGRQGMEGVTKSKKYAGDYGTPEQQVGILDMENPWETCMTIAKQWAWKPNDVMKSKEECIHTLLQTVGGDGNLLFNVGPMPDGRIEQRQTDRLAEMGNWLRVNGEAVYGTRGGPYFPTEYMVSTRKGNQVFLHILQHPGAVLELPFPKDVQIAKASFLQNNTALTFEQMQGVVQIHLPKQLPDETASVIVLEINKPALEMEVIKRNRY